jgi:hypothetical protein
MSRFLIAALAVLTAATTSFAQGIIALSYHLLPIRPVTRPRMGTFLRRGG